MLVAVPLLLVGVARRARVGGWRSGVHAVGMLAAFAALLAQGPRMEMGWNRIAARVMRADELARVQRGVVAHWTTRSNDAALEAACRVVPEATMLTPAFLRTPCAELTLRHNLESPVKTLAHMRARA